MVFGSLTLLCVIGTFGKYFSELEKINKINMIEIDIRKANLNCGGFCPIPFLDLWNKLALRGWQFGGYSLCCNH
jgi:hypothetical protein